MFEDDEICEGKFVRWRDPRNAENYGLSAGPFLVVRVKEDKVAPRCTCGSEGGGLLDDGHSLRCELRAKEVVATFITILAGGRHCSLPEDLFEVVPEPWR
jgi:hypothetical protein